MPALRWRSEAVKQTQFPSSMTANFCWQTLVTVDPRERPSLAVCLVDGVGAVWRTLRPQLADFSAFLALGRLGSAQGHRSHEIVGQRIPQGHHFDLSQPAHAKLPQTTVARLRVR